MDKSIYVIAGCNGAGKTTASFTLLPEILNCKEFVNADEIARGLSPFQPEKVALEAGRLMLTRINHLLHSGENFAFETTLSTRSYVSFLKKAKQEGYNVVLLFFWLRDVNLAIERVKVRVQEGGHYIPEETIRRRYFNGIKNLFDLYLDVVDEFMIIDNSNEQPIIIASGAPNSYSIIDKQRFEELKKYNDEKL